MIRPSPHDSRALRARLEQRGQNRVFQRGRGGVQIRHAQDLGLNAVADRIVAAQVVGRTGNDALAVLPRSVHRTVRSHGTSHKQQLNLATHASSKDGAQQLDVANGLGMRREIGREVDHTVEFVSLVQVLQQLFPRRMERRPVAARLVGRHDLNMVTGKRLGTKVVIDIHGIANNQHFHRALPLPKFSFCHGKHAYCTLSM